MMRGGPRVLIEISDVVEVHAHPVDGVVAGIVVTNRPCRHRIRAPDHRDVRGQLVHDPGHQPELFAIELGVAVIADPGPVHLTGKPDEDSRAGHSQADRQVAQVVILDDLFQAAIGLQGDMNVLLATVQIADPVGRERLPVTQIKEVDRVRATDI